MITLRYLRTQDGIFVPHVDIMRSLNRTFRRAGIDVRYSNGFNHHMTLKLTQPLPFGVTDMDGYATTEIKNDFSLAELFELLNKNCPPYIKIVGLYRTEKSPNLAGIVNCSSYRVTANLSEKQIDCINSIGNNYEITMRKSGEKKAVGEMIYHLKADQSGIDATLAFGNVNLRIDLLTEQFNEDFGTNFNVVDATRMGQYIKTDKMISAEEYLDSICLEKYISKE